MRALVLTGAALAALAVPATAFPCSQALGIFGESPEEGTLFPANGQLLVGVSPSSQIGIFAELDYGSDGLPIELNSRPFGPHHAVIELPPLRAPATIYATVEHAGPGPNYFYGITNLGRDDLTPPSDPTNFTLEAEWIEFDMCFGPGLRLSGSFVRGYDDIGVAAHVLSRTLPNDAREIAGVMLEPSESTGPERSFNIFWPTAERPPDGSTLCLNLQAIDVAHNWSSPRGPVGCVTFGDPVPPPPPPPPVDAGFVDSGTTPPPPPRDAGTTRDGGSAQEPPPNDNKGLATADPGCGCASTSSSTDSAAPGFALFVLALLVRRRLTHRR